MGAWEDAVNEKFVKDVGQILANADKALEMDKGRYINELIDLYETTIDELPEPNEDEEDE